MSEGDSPFESVPVPEDIPTQPAEPLLLVSRRGGWPIVLLALLVVALAAGGWAYSSKKKQPTAVRMDKTSTLAASAVTVDSLSNATYVLNDGRTVTLKNGQGTVAGSGSLAAAEVNLLTDGTAVLDMDADGTNDAVVLLGIVSGTAGAQELKIGVSHNNLLTFYPSSQPVFAKGEGIVERVVNGSDVVFTISTTRLDDPQGKLRSAAYELGKNSQGQPDLVEITAGTTSSSHFANDSGGYSFDFPADWTRVTYGAYGPAEAFVSPATAAKVITPMLADTVEPADDLAVNYYSSLEDMDPNLFGDLQFNNHQDPTLAELVRAIPGTIGYHASLLGGEPSYVATFTAGDSPYEAKGLVIFGEHNGKIYKLSFDALTAEGQMSAGQKLVVSSFKFSNR